MRATAERQDDAPSDPFGEQAAGHRAPDGGGREDEEEDADARIGLLEGGLDRADQRRDQQAGPSDEQHPGAGEGSGDRGPGQMGCGHVQMLAASCRDCPDARPGRYRRAMARPTTPARGGAARNPRPGPPHPPSPRRPCRAASCSSSTARTRPRRAWSRPWHGSRTRSVPAAGTSRSSRRSGAAGPACDSGTGRRRSTAAAVPRRCRSRSCAAGSARTR